MRDRDYSRPGSRLLVRLLTPGLGVFHQYEPRRLSLPARYTRPRECPAGPRVSIVTPSLNQAQFIERTIRSVLTQGYGPLQYIVQDGGSCDGTQALLAGFRDAIDVESRADAGQAAAINAGIARATGDILAYLNADDLLLPGAVAFVAAYFARHPEVDVVYGHRLVIDADDREIGRWVLPKHDDAVLSWVDFVPQETLFWRRRIWDAVGGLDEALHCVMDWDLLLRFRSIGARFARLPRFLGALRVHAAQKMDAHGETCAREADRLRRRIHGRAVTQAEVMANVWPYLARHIVVQRLHEAGLLRY